MQLSNIDFEELLRTTIDYYNCNEFEKAVIHVKKIKKEYHLSDTMLDECDSWLALILRNQGKEEQALKIYQDLALRIGPSSYLFFSIHKTFAELLFTLNQTQEAIKIINKALDYKDQASMIDLLSIFNLFATISAFLNRTIPSQYRPVLTELKSKIDISSLPQDFTFRDLNELALLLFTEHKSGNLRYSTLMIALTEAASDSIKIDILKQYISIEVIGFYKKLASKLIEDILKRLEDRNITETY